MVTAERSHPDPQLLAAYELALLSPEVMAEIEAHLLACEGCCLVLEDRIDHSFLAKVKKAGQTPHGGWTASWTPRDLDAPATPVTATPHEGPRNHTPGDAGEPDARPALWEALADHPRYVIRGVIGEGGMGVVFLAEHRLMGRQVALKAIKASLRGDPTIQARFQREVRANARLSHPNIAAAHDADQAGAVCFLAMEYVEGEDLGQRVERLGRLPVAQACGFAHQAAMGLDHAHRKGLIHRDVKPHNMRLKPDGTLKLLDFGLARVLHEVSQGVTLTQSLALMGTPDYVAPEQAFSPHAADGRADIYSLGCSLYHLLAGRPPFPGGSLQEKLERHLVGTPAPLRTIRDDVPAELEAVVAKMMAKAVNERYQTAGEVAEALRPFLVEPRPKAEPPRRGRPGWRVALAASVLFVAGLLGVVTYTIKTEKGEFVLKTDLPKGSKVVISQDGDDISILDGDKLVVKLKAGKYTARIEGAPPGWELETTDYVLKLGGKEAVKATWKPNEAPPPNGKSAAKPNPALKPGELAPGITEWSPEVRVSGETKGIETWGQVAIDATGRFVVVWARDEGKGTATYGRLFEAGKAVGPPFRIDSTAKRAPQNPKVAMTPDGRFVVAWSRQEARDQGVYAQRFAANGKPAGDVFQVNTNSAPNPVVRSVVMDPKGGFLVAYLLGRSENLPYFQRFDGAGSKVGLEKQVDGRANVDEHQLSMAIAPDGRVAAAYLHAKDIWLQCFDANGSPNGRERRVTSSRNTANLLGNPAFDAMGRLWVAWDEASEGANVGVYLRRYDARWNEIDHKERLVGEGGVQGGYTVLGLRGTVGDSLVAWNSGYIGTRIGVIRYIDPSGQPRAPTFPVSHPFEGDQIVSSIAINDRGQAAVVWMTGTPDRNHQLVFVRGFQLPARPR